MTSACIASLVLEIKLINVRAQIIDGSIFQTFDMTLASFKVDNKLD